MAEPARSEAPTLSVRGVSAGYDRTPVVREVSLEVEPATVTLVMGPNGCGKSTLAKALAGVIPIMAGTVLLGDEDVTGLRSDLRVRRGIGYVPQVRDVFDPLTVAENLAVSGYTLDKSTLERRKELVYATFPRLERLGRRLAVNLSGGERKMLATARVLMTRPSLLVLDEPTAGLAPKIAHAFLTEHVAQLASQDVAILLVEQRAREALTISNWAYVMAAGSVRLHDRASVLLERDDIGQIFLGKIDEVE